MRKTLTILASTLLLAACASQAHATPVTLVVSGSGISSTVTLNYGPSTDARYPQAYEVTSVSGTFTDTNLGITNATITKLEGLNLATPEPGNLLTPHDFSSYRVDSGLAPEANNAIHYDNLFWPGGSLPTATNYPFGGGVLDIYGILFDLSTGQVVNLWSNGVPPNATLSYGVAVVTHDQALDYAPNVAVTAATPEPGSLCLLGTGVIALLSRRRLLLKA